MNSGEPVGAVLHAVLVHPETRQIGHQDAMSGVGRVTTTTLLCHVPRLVTGIAV